MKLVSLTTLAVATAAALGLSVSPAMARKWNKPMHHASAMQMPKAQVIERGPHGHATKVSVDGKDYAVCSTAVTDNCIQPRQAGLDWGNTPINYWPGKPASDIPGKLPMHKPDAS